MKKLNPLLIWAAAIVVTIAAGLGYFVRQHLAGDPTSTVLPRSIGYAFGPVAVGFLVMWLWGMRRPGQRQHAFVIGLLVAFALLMVSLNTPRPG